MVNIVPICADEWMVIMVSSRHGMVVGGGGGGTVRKKRGLSLFVRYEKPPVSVRCREPSRLTLNFSCDFAQLLDWPFIGMQKWTPENWKRTLENKGT
eukprot:scaffold17613_cov24-Cyclotella_meneghiniana.AAC.1